jgi:dihydrolipoamide dehydrogenase
MVSNERVDTLTLGAGGGAYPAAFALARAGQQVVMIDPKGVMSGNCLAEGCVPSKAVRELAEMRRRSRLDHFRAVLGNQIGAVDYEACVAHKDSVQQLRYRQHAEELAHLSGHLRLVKGSARLMDPHTVEVETPDGPQRWWAEQVIVATGADITVPAIPGTEYCLTSRDLFALEPNLTRLPESLVVIGGGYIGVEVASMMQAFGSRVVILEAMNQLLPGMDPDFAGLLAAGLDPEIQIRLGAPVEAIERSGTGRLRVRYSLGGQSQSVEGEAVLLAVGRHPVVPDGAEEVGLKLNGRGLAVTPSMQVPGFSHIYAPGDVNARSMLFHSAVRQSLVAAHNILAGNRPQDRMDFRSVPTTVFSWPEAAIVGITRAEAVAKGIEVVEGSYSFAEDSRAQIMGEPYGEIRLFFDAERLEVLGGWVVGVDAAQLIGEIGQAVSAGLDAWDLARFPSQHPMAGEGIAKAARSIVG